jgi:hypothetical protein
MAERENCLEEALACLAPLWLDFGFWVGCITLVIILANHALMPLTPPALINTTTTTTTITTALAQTLDPKASKEALNNVERHDRD